MQIPFKAANILLPKQADTRYAVVACDQFTSQAEYWDAAEALVGDAPSTLRMVLPEIYLSGDVSARIRAINEKMDAYLADNIFTAYPDAMIYVERTLPDGSCRRGIVGAVDLTTYSFVPGEKTLIRATEGTVLERIPPRVEIRKDAPLELPHVMLLIDDPKRTVIEPLADLALPVVYDFDLMLGGGHLRGALIPADVQAQITSALAALCVGDEPFLFAVGDGNHSLATAKACYEKNPSEVTRFALAEVVNIHDEALYFEPIYRVLFDIDAEDCLSAFAAYLAALPDRGIPAQSFTAITVNGKREIVATHPAGALPVGTLQQFLDDYLKAHPSVRIDYIHGADVTERLASAPNALGFLFAGMEKADLFPAVATDGVLPRKTFSMGEAASKRYYMEARKLKS